MGDILKDDRFSKFVKEPRYRQIPKTERKVKIDKRFRSMFDNDNFKVKYAVDKRGKPIKRTSSEDLKKYYDVASEESDGSDDDSEETGGKFVCHPANDANNANNENDKLDKGHIPKNVRKKLRDLDIDYARGEDALFSDTSSDEETEHEDMTDDIEHKWGELDGDAETCEDPTHRLAICNMDWDNIKASDLFILFNSFLPTGGSLKSVTIYPSEFGLKRMEEEESRGPVELTKTKSNEMENDNEENEEGSKYHMEKLRQYQLNRLKYYYGVIVFDSAATANKIYSECDGIEYESSATKLDLRFIPNDVTFDQQLHEECTEAPDINRFKPRTFVTTALQQAKVHLTWDATNPHRTETLKSALDGDIKDDDLRNYLAYSSSDEDSDNDSDGKEIEKNENANGNKVDPVSKYKMLLQEIEETEKKKKDKDVEMEISWGLGLKEKTEELVEKKLNKVEKLTPFEEMIEKQKEKKKTKRLKKKNKYAEENEDYSSDDIPSDIDMNDTYFAEEFERGDFKKKSNTKDKIKTNHKLIEDEDENEKKKLAELELLLDDDDKTKAHFSLKGILDMEKSTKSKKKKQKKIKTDEVTSEFKIDTNDDRFSALFTSHHYNIDPSDPNFKKTKAMETLVQEKLKRRTVEHDTQNSETLNKKSKKDPAVSILINSIKRKTSTLSTNK